MMNFNKLIKSSRYINILLFVSTLVVACALFWLSIFEFSSIKEIRHIVSTDLKETHFQLEKSLYTEIKSHLTHHIIISYIVLFSILIVVIFLVLTSFLTFVYFRRLKNINSNKQLLEELLYYDQLSETHHASADNLPIAIRKFQLNRDTFISELQKGLTENQFVLYYQPIISIHSEKIVDVEALIRWQHPTHGLLPPDVFLPLCENSGFIIPLGEWIFDQACQQMGKWHEMGFSKLRISINLSTRQLNDDKLIPLIKTMLTTHNISPQYIKLEITEQSVMRDINSSINILKLMRQMGLQLSLDDFGTGYSSLHYLKKMPISNLKIDKSFINDVTSNITSLGIVESVINLGKSLGLTITAEGVENKNQLHLLKNMQCDLVQGYLYSKPVPADEFTQLLLVSENHTNKPYDLTLNEKKFRYAVLSSEHFDQAINVISHAFCEYEPMTKYLSISTHEFIPFAKLMVEKAIKDGLSIVALDNDKVSACTIVEDIAEPLNITIDLDPRFKIIFTLLEDLASEFFSERILHKNHIAHLFITAVDKNYHGHGLSKKINFESIRLAKENGFDFMRCEFTHDYNEQGTIKNLTNSKLLLRTCVYKDFIFENKKPFAHLKGSASAYIWELREGAQLQYQIKSL